jgi:hypothetical protein
LMGYFFLFLFLDSFLILIFLWQLLGCKLHDSVRVFGSNGGCVYDPSFGDGV